MRREGCLSPEVGAHHFNELVGTLTALGCARDLRIGQVRLNMVLHDLSHQAVDGTAHRGNLLQDFGAAVARSSASTWPRMRRTRARSFAFSRVVWLIALPAENTLGEYCIGCGARGAAARSRSSPGISCTRVP